MKFAAFKYTDTKGKITQRKVLITEQPTNKMTGIDVGELDSAQAEAFARRYDKLLDTFRQQALELQVEFDVKHNYRQFLRQNIENLEVVQAYA